MVRFVKKVIIEMLFIYFFYCWFYVVFVIFFFYIVFSFFVYLLYFLVLVDLWKIVLFLGSLLFGVKLKIWEGKVNGLVELDRFIIL